MKLDFRKKVPTQRKIGHLNRILRSSPTYLHPELTFNIEDYGKKAVISKI